VGEILQMIRVLGGIVGAADKGHQLADRLQRGLGEIRSRAAHFSRRPRVYFEEWDNPLISGIQWVEELIEIAGGDPVFPQLRHAKLAKDRIVSDDAVIAAAPDVIIGSWCGKPVRKERIAARPGWDRIPAVRAGDLYEIKSTYILQPGPASLTEGVQQLHGVLAAWEARHRDVV
jgi:iron complex transport system substrate-binding protein